MTKFVFSYKDEAIASLEIDTANSITPADFLGVILTKDTSLENTFRYILSTIKAQRGHPFGYFKESISGSIWGNATYNDIAIVSSQVKKIKDWGVKIESSIEITPLPVLEYPLLD
jgi:hypothetical protein